MNKTGENVLRVISMIADEVDKRLMYLPEVQEIKACDVKKVNDKYGYSWAIDDDDDDDI